MYAKVELNLDSDRTDSGLQIRERNGKLFFLFLNRNICCEYSNNRLNEHPKHMFKLMDKKINRLQFYAQK